MSSDVARGAPSQAPAPAPDLTRGYLHQVDVVRLLTFGSVIAVHVVAATTAQASVPARGTLMLLHFTRETFFVITGFVLFHSYYRRDLHAGRFWRKRYLLIGVPYVTWSVLYWLQGTSGLRELAVALLTGTAQYHLYFLLVSMQVYLVFPWLLRLVRATEGRHGALLAGTAAFQLLLFWFLHDAPPSWRAQPGWVSGLVRYAEELLPSYLLYVVAGALAAVHLARLQAWVEAHGRGIVVGVAVGAVLTEAVYVLQVATGSFPTHASEVLQPVMVVWTLVLTAGLLAVGLRYARHRRPGPVAALVAEASRISFGIFLVHPLVISILQSSPFGRFVGAVPQPLAAVVLWVTTVVSSFALVEVFARSPMSLALTGRRRERTAS